MQNEDIYLQKIHCQVKLYLNLGDTSAPFTDSHKHIYITFGIRGCWETLVIFIFFTVMTQNYLGTAATSQNATAFHWER